jgi:hypothetical protein
MPGSSRWSSLVVAVARLLVNRGCHDERLFVRIQEVDPSKNLAASSYIEAIPVPVEF